MSSQRPGTISLICASYQEVQADYRGRIDATVAGSEAGLRSLGSDGATILELPIREPLSASARVILLAKCLGDG